MEVQSSLAYSSNTNTFEEIICINKEEFIVWRKHKNITTSCKKFFNELEDKIYVMHHEKNNDFVSFVSFEYEVQVPFNFSVYSLKRFETLGAAVISDEDYYINPSGLIDFYKINKEKTKIFLREDVDYKSQKLLRKYVKIESPKLLINKTSVWKKKMDELKKNIEKL